MEDWAEIRRLHRAEGMPIKAIARQLGLARNTVRAAIASDVPPRYERAPTGSIVDPFVPGIEALLREFPTMPASVIGQRIGWEHSASVLRAKVAQLRLRYAPPDPVAGCAGVPGRSSSAICGSRPRWSRTSSGWPGPSRC